MTQGMAWRMIYAFLPLLLLHWQPRCFWTPLHSINKTHTDECISLECEGAARTYIKQTQTGKSQDLSPQPYCDVTVLTSHCVAHWEWGNYQMSVSLYFLAAALLRSSDWLSQRNAYLFKDCHLQSLYWVFFPPAILFEFGWMLCYYGFNQYILIAYFIIKFMNSKMCQCFWSNETKKSYMSGQTIWGKKKKN